MKTRLAAVTLLGLAAPSAAGGLFIPGSGAVSSSRAGASVSSTEGGEALGLNPAGLAKSKGTTITLSMAIVNYALEFTRRGNYDATGDNLPYEGDPFPTVKNDANPELGIGRWQPIPVFAVVSDLGGAVKGLTAAVGVWAPNAYPFRDLCTVTTSGCEKFSFEDFNRAPLPARYDIIKQSAAIILPTVAVAYRITDQLDVGGRFSPGIADFESEVAVWSTLDNYDENVKKDGLINVKAKDKFVPAWGLGATFRPTPAIEVGAQYTSQMNVYAKGDAVSTLGVSTNFSGNPIAVKAVEPGRERCAAGGTDAAQKACIEIAVPRNVSVGGRYKFLRADGRQAGDVELQVGWENWAADRASTFRVSVDSAIYTRDANGMERFASELKDSNVRNSLQNVYTMRLGGSYAVPLSGSELIFRGGVAYDSAAAKEGWLRMSIDGMARTTATIGVGYKARRFQVDAGFGMTFDMGGDVPGTCNPTGRTAMPQNDTFGCGPGGVEQDIEDRTGPDPVTPILIPEEQAENPVNQGTFKGRYTMFMLGVSTWF